MGPKKVFMDMAREMARVFPGLRAESLIDLAYWLQARHEQTIAALLKGEKE